MKDDIHHKATIPQFEMIDNYRRECSGDIERLEELSQFLAYERYMLVEDISCVRFPKKIT